MLALLRHQFLFLLAVFHLNVVVRSAVTCYLPDGSVANKDDTVYQPCNATAAQTGEGSACCDLGSSVCLSTGFCFGSDSYIYRGGCTDRQWSSGNCPSQCLDAQPDRYANIYPCGSNGEGGTYTQNFCCGGLKGGSMGYSCCDETFFMRNGLGLPYVPPSSALALPDIRTSTNESSDTVAPVAATWSPQAPPPASPSPTSPPSSSNTTAVAAGVAVPLGVMLIAALAFLAYRERQRKKLVEELLAEKTQILSNSGGGDGGAAADNERAREIKGYYSQELRSELPTEGRGGRAELASTLGPFHEVGIMSPK